jgi:hypothetical protein
VNQIPTTFYKKLTQNRGYFHNFQENSNIIKNFIKNLPKHLNNVTITK